MLRSSILFLLVLTLPHPGATKAPHASAGDSGRSTYDGPGYTTDGQLKFPEKYREWVFLSSGMDMSYNPAANAANHSTFDNVFVNPAAYQAFMETGKWPDRTTLVLEIRGAESNQSINKRGRTQSPELAGLEVHVKDKSLAGGWGFFEFDKGVSAKRIEQSASCYTCHGQHGAVDTTFVQFYPTLLGVAKTKGTLSAAYLKETSTTETDK